VVPHARAHSHVKSPAGVVVDRPLFPVLFRLCARVVNRTRASRGFTVSLSLTSSREQR